MQGLDDAESADGEAAENRQLAQFIVIRLQTAVKVGVVCIKFVVRERYAHLFGLVWSPVVERTAVAVVGREHGRRSAVAGIFSNASYICGIHAHQHFAEGDIGLGECPKEGFLVGHASSTDCEATNHIFAGGRRCDDGLVCLLTCGSKLGHSVVAKGTDYGQHVLARGQLLAQLRKVLSQLVVPLQFQVDAKRVVKL